MAFKNPSTGGRTDRIEIRLGLGGRNQLTELARWHKRLDNTMNKIKNIKTDMRSVWTEVQGVVFADIEETFATEGKNLLKKEWKPLTARYEKRKLKALGGRDRGILTYTGVMRGSIVVDTKTDNVLRVVAKDRKAPLHHFGLVPPKSNKALPRRPFMMLSSDAVRSIIQVFKDVIDAALDDRKQMKILKKRKETLPWSETRKIIKNRRKS